MMFSRLTRFLLLAVVGFFPGAVLALELGPKHSVLDKPVILAAAKAARADGVGSGWCGRGTLSVLTGLGVSEGLQGANGHDWEGVLWQGGWRPISCSSPDQAPYGSILVYDSDMRRLGFNRRGTPGGRWGHVEMVGYDTDGERRVYVSDSPRVRPGGTVLDNFTQRAWVPPSFVGLYERLRGRKFPVAPYFTPRVVKNLAPAQLSRLGRVVDLNEKVRPEDLDFYDVEPPLPQNPDGDVSSKSVLVESVSAHGEDPVRVARRLEILTAFRLQEARKSLASLK